MIVNPPLWLLTPPSLWLSDLVLFLRKSRKPRSGTSPPRQAFDTPCHYNPSPRHHYCPHYKFTWPLFYPPALLLLLKNCKSLLCSMFNEQTCSRFTWLFVLSSPCPKYLWKPYTAIFLKSPKPKLIFPTVKYTNTQIQIHKCSLWK